MAVTQESWLDAQYSVLGSVLISPELTPKLLHETSERDFHGTCQTVYKAIRKVFQAGIPVDPVSVNHALGDGYTQFLLQLMEITPTAAHIGRYITLCKEQARTVSLRDLARAMAEEESPEKLRSLLGDMNAAAVEKSSVRSVSMYDSMSSFMERHVGEPQFYRWPIQELNGEIRAKAGKYVIFGGMPSTGKTAWAMQCAWFWAQDKKVGFFSLETDEHTLFDRLMSSISGISYDAIQNNELSPGDWDRVCQISTEITKRNLDLIPAAGCSPADIQAVSMMKGYDIIFIDYLQLLQAPGVNRTEQVTQISIALHIMAQSLGVMVVALSQVNRDSQQGGKSEMSAFRESGQIEQDADIAMIFRLEDEKNPNGNRIMSVAKNKEGERFKMLLSFDGKHQTFSRTARTKDVLGEMVKDGKRIRRMNKETAQRAQDEQMSILPDDYQVPF